MLESILTVDGTYSYMEAGYPEFSNVREYSHECLQEPFGQPTVQIAGKSISWLPYKAATVTVIKRASNIDYLSGYFSGCWMVHFSIGNQEFVGHIGSTPEKASDGKVKTFWNDRLTGAPGFRLHDGFRPHEAFTVSERIGSGKKRDVIGLMVFPGCKKYSVLVEIDRLGKAIKIIGIKEILEKESNLRFRSDGGCCLVM